MTRAEIMDTLRYAFSEYEKLSDDMGFIELKGKDREVYQIHGELDHTPGGISRTGTHHGDLVEKEPEYWELLSIEGIIYFDNDLEDLDTFHPNRKEEQELINLIGYIYNE